MGLCSSNERRSQESTDVPIPRPQGPAQALPAASASPTNLPPPPPPPPLTGNYNKYAARNLNDIEVTQIERLVNPTKFQDGKMATEEEHKAAKKKFNQQVADRIKLDEERSKIKYAKDNTPIVLVDLPPVEGPPTDDRDKESDWW